MSSSSDATLIVSLNNISLQLNRAFAIFIFLFGVVGNLFNILVLSQRSLRSNPCAWLFLVSSIAYCINIVSSLIPRLLSTWNADIASTNQFLCKLRVFIFYDSITIASWLITLATVDRWLLSSTGVCHGPASNSMGQKNRRKKIDRQLLIMLLAQVLIILVLTLPIALSKLYTTITSNMLKSILRSSIESFPLQFLSSSR